MSSRRAFLTGTAAAVSGSLVACSGTPGGDAGPDTATRPARNHPLDGLTRENVTVSDIKVTLLSREYPAEEQWYLDWIPERYKAWKSDSILVEVFTNQGIVGIGGATQYGGPPEVKKFIEETIKPLLVGQNVFDAPFLTCGVSRRGPLVGWGGVDSALWDVIGKVKGVPVYELLATDHDPQPRVPVYASAGEMYEGDVWPDNLIEEALGFKEQGFTAWKFRPGTHWSVSGMTVPRYVKGLAKIRAGVGDDFQLIQECNRQWTPEQVLEMCPVFEELGFLWIEDPTPNWVEGAMDSYVRIREALPTVMVSYGGDSIENRFQYKEWIDRGTLDIVQPDCGVGGTVEAWHISRMAHLFDKVVAPHNWHGGLLTMANAHLAAGIPNLLMLEAGRTFNPLREAVFKEPLVVVDGHMQLPDKPGFGVEVIDDLAERFPYIPGRYDQPRPIG
jgi:L-alanine-DL-glutamate epimerase-like enolase superfamily enzyme